MTTEMTPVTVAVVEPSSRFEGKGGVEGGVEGVGGVAPPSLLLFFSGSSAKVETMRRGAGLLMVEEGGGAKRGGAVREGKGGWRSRHLHGRRFLSALDCLSFCKKKLLTEG